MYACGREKLVEREGKAKNIFRSLFTCMAVNGI
jgi:hypothetical protein